MNDSRNITMDELVDILGLERDPRHSPDSASFNVRCPFCSGKGYKMNINTVKNTYHCFRCSGDDKHTGVLDLYGRVRFGTPLVPGEYGNARELSAKLREEAGCTQIPQKRAASSFSKSYEEIYPAEDKKLDVAFSALLGLGITELSEEHRENLLSRGLSAEQIDRNGYGTLRPAADWVKNHKKYETARTLFYESGMADERMENGRLKRIPVISIIAGLIIANELRLLGVDMLHVPGFYRLGNRMIFNYEPGMLIPTRNSCGQITGLQIRRDNVKKGGPRYMTVSSKGFSDGPTAGISRTHFPLGNCVADNGVPATERIILTEGPLKADVASALLGAPSYFIALQGVNNAKELPAIVESLAKNGIRKVYSAFDMDKVINPYVAEAGKKARTKFEKSGIELVPLLWDSGCAEEYRELLREYCAESGIDWLRREHILAEISANMAALLKFSIAGFDEFTEKHPWPGAKGIDDYLHDFTVRRNEKIEH